MLEGPKGSAGNVGSNAEVASKTSGLGCAFSILGLNALIFGFLALSFTQGPFASWGQELWYRYASLGLLLGGAVLPGSALLLGAGRSRRAVIFLTLWMIVWLFVGVGYAINSGGGV